jgi:hypothetical protein
MFRKPSGSRNLQSLILPGFIIAFLIPEFLYAQRTEFSQDSAYAFLTVLVSEIGPRPMGSPAEQKAMEWATAKFREFGCQDAYIMPMAVAERVNTKSGIAIGVSKGKTNRIIIIGGHIDSSGPDVPGANDDGSGVACVLELARVLSKQQHQSTIMFCCWGGEEQGLRGSKYFVEHFDRLDSIDLMLQIDMADGASILEIDPDFGQINSPRWLTEAAYDVFFSELHSKGLVYPVASATLNSFAGGATGSDHDAFLEKGIPAIDFTSDVDYPIHTPQDNIESFQPSGLKRTGDLVLRLFERFDAGVPSRTTEQYMLIQLGAVPVFLPHWLLWTFVCGSVVVAVISTVVMRRRKLIVEAIPKVRWSTIKIILFTLTTQVLIWSSESLIGLIKGYRFPWVNNFTGFVLLGVLFGLIGLWLVLKWIGRLPLSADEFVFGWRAVLLLSFFTILTSLQAPELAVFFALALVFLSVAFYVRQPGARVLFWILSCLTLLRLVFFEELGLIQRIITENKIHTVSGLLGYEAVFPVLFTVLSLPFAFGLAAIYRASSVDLLWLKKFRSNFGLLIVVGLAMGVSVYLIVQDVYDARWFNNITVEQRYNLGADSSRIELRGSDNLNGTMMRAGFWEMKFIGRTNYHEFTSGQPAIVRWTALDRTIDSTRSAGNTITILRDVRLHSLLRPYTLTISYRSSLPFAVESRWAHGNSLRLGRESDSVKIFSWYSFPDTDLVLPVAFRLQKGQKVAERVEVIYDTLAHDLRLQREFTNIQYRTIVVAADTFSSDVHGLTTGGGSE